MDTICNSIKAIMIRYCRFLPVSFYILLLATFNYSCEDFLEIDPPKNEIVTETVFTSDASATAAIRGIYSLMMTNQSFTNSGVELYTGLSADELINHSPREAQVQFFTNSLTSTNNDVQGIFWMEAYKYISNVNAILEGLRNAPAITTATKDQLEGEAKFIRAFCHFYLVNMFGDVPYITTTNFEINAEAGRMPQAEAYQKIIDDLQEAKRLTSDDFSFSNNERVQPNHGAATALLARVYLYTEDWVNAEEQSTKVIENTSLYALESDLNNVFLANSMEAIWQLQPVVPGGNTRQAQIFILNLPPNNVSLSGEVFNTFETTDSRKVNWIGSFTDGTDTFYYPFKYKEIGAILLEYSTVLRLAEQYLIRAEARAQRGNIEGSQADLDIIRNRAGLSNTSANDQASLLLAIQHERRVELFAEWGHRWLDLKRTGKTDEVLGPIKADWQSTDIFYPIPQSEIEVNPNLLPQNDGY